MYCRLINIKLLYYRGESGCAQERRGVVYPTDKLAISGIPDLIRGEPS